jgi:hypothetical protein
VISSYKYTFISDRVLAFFKKKHAHIPKQKLIKALIYLYAHNMYNISVIFRRETLIAFVKKKKKSSFKL